MALEEHKELWTTDLPDYALLRPIRGTSEGDYTIVHKATRTALIIEDPEEARQVIIRMLQAGAEVWDTLPSQRDRR